MSRRPLIGITTSVTVDRTPERAYVNSAYLRAVQSAGGIPLLLPPGLDSGARDRLLAILDGLLLTGGGDVDPGLFGEAPHPTTAEVAPARDSLEIAATRVTLERARPLLAICRGIQVLNVAFGGSLFQDVGSDPGTPVRHNQPEPRDQPMHKIKVAAGSRLAAVLGTEEVDVNSMHHQAIKVPGRGLLPVAWAPDQIVEGAELDDPARFVLGVQWHPEELVGHSEPARRLFAALIHAART
ncbi:MAG: gamma-glutamyl-gamma-aminobutyrate hydrolase family protein [Candidatus Rokubacteria bacterium]|nr:gamma-glutamyl-gamma-aminobutyrate hydrolase family protein [Candidatus Rokubacteria bacterium]